MSARVVVCAVSVAALACSASPTVTGPQDALGLGVPPDVIAGECTLVSYGGTSDGACVAVWICRTAGTRTLSCGMVGSGSADSCHCTNDDGTTLDVAAVPASCLDPVALAAFATAKCGWSGL